MRACLMSVAALMLVLSGCGKGDDTGTKKTDGKKAQATEKAPAKKAAGKKPAAPAKSAIKVDAKMMDGLKAVVAACDIKPKSMSIKCKGDELKKLKDMHGYRKGQMKAPKGLGTVAVALASKDPKMQSIAAKMLTQSFRSWQKPSKEDVTQDVARTLVNALPNLGDYQVRAAAHVAAYAATFAGIEKELFKTLDGLKDTYAKRAGYQRVMTYGRLKAFGKIKELATSKESADVRVALKALNEMYKWTDAEKAVVCPWAQTFLTADKDPKKESVLFREAGYALTRCGGKYIDALLTFGEKQLKEKHLFDRSYYFVYRGICFSIAKILQKEAGRKSQCDRNYAFLEKVANDPKTGKWGAYGLDAIAYQRRDGTSYKLMKKYENSKNPEIQKIAKDWLKKLKP